MGNKKKEKKIMKKLKANHAQIKRVQEVIADFEEKYNNGEVSALAVVVDPQWGYHFAPFNYDAVGIVLHSTVSGTKVSTVSMW